LLLSAHICVFAGRVVWRWRSRRFYRWWWWWRVRAIIVGHGDIIAGRLAHTRAACESIVARGIVGD
jgi:hypothetical protein